MSIPFNEPFLTGNELAYIEKSLAQKKLSGDGPFSKLCQSWLEQNLKTKKAILTPSCTSALEMAAILIDIKPGDEVIMPSYTFVSGANAFVLRGGVPVFVDIEPGTMNIDANKIEAAITERTKAISPMHYAGVGCDMDKIMAIAEKHHLYVVEDSAQGMIASYKNRPLGSIGHLGATSFLDSKNITSGEGGALFINDPEFLERAEIVHEKGTDRTKFMLGQIDKYTWRDIGSSYLPSDMLAGFLYAQLEERLHIMEHRCQIWNQYYKALKDWAVSKGICLPFIPSYCEQSFHMFYMLMPTDKMRQAFINYMD